MYNNTRCHCCWASTSAAPCVYICTYLSAIKSLLTTTGYGPSLVETVDFVMKMDSVVSEVLQE